MVRVVELLGTMFTVAAYIGLVIGLIMAWRWTRRRELAWSLFGVILIETSRAIRIFGPDLAVEPGDGSLRLTDDSSVVILFGNVLLMPIGYCVAAVGTAAFAWRYLRRRARIE